LEALVELHAFDEFERGFHRLAFFDGDDAVFADLFHGVGQEVADDAIVVGADCADVGDFLLARHLLGDRVEELGRALRWSPDGTQIAFVRPGSSAGDSLYVARYDGGSPREVAALRGAMHIHWPVWSHDGRYIYFNYSFSTANREPASIYRVAAEGGPVEPVVPTARRAVFAFPTPDGKGLIYSANPHGVDLALWWRPFDRSEPTRLTTGIGEYAEASMTADGQTLISSLVQSRRALTLFSISGSASTQAITSGSTGDFDPMLSPDGTRLVFTSSRSGFQNLWTSGPDGTMARALTSGNAFDEQPAFSPDGTRLAFVSDRGGRRSIWTMSADGGIPERLVNADVVDRLVWSSDGRRILFAVTGDTPTLQSVNVADGTIQPVRTPGPAVTPIGFVGDALAYLEPFPGSARTPNLTRVAFVDEGGNSTSIDALRSLNLANGSAVISPDGQRIAGIVNPGGGASSIWIADLRRGTQFQKAIDLPADVLVRGATWAGSDRLIVGTT